jgi:hypothetical protein
MNPPDGDGPTGETLRVAVSASVYRRRRAAAVGGALVALAATTAGMFAGARAGDGGGAAARAAPPAPAPEQLPGGGRRLFPDRRVVAFYGAPQDPQLGVLGVGTPRQAAAKLRRVARRYSRRSRPALPAFELLATIAAAHPGPDGLYRLHQPDDVIDRYLRAARRIGALLVLDIQPGRGDFLGEARRLERWLREPDVGLALDPEWHVGPTEVPGGVIGSVTAAEVNAVSAYVAGLVTAADLPEKLFVVHQFTSGMVDGKASVLRRPGLAVTMNADGFGGRAVKRQKYHVFTAEAARFHDGFKLFYEEDVDLMGPGDVLRLRPPPDLVVYE